MEIQIPAGEFKAKCLKILDNVYENRDSYIITKRGKPFARVMSIESAEKRSPYGALAGSLTILGDIISPAFDSGGWEALRS